MSKKSRAQRARERPCNVFMESHGCKKQRGHSGSHICSCRLVFPPGAHLFGEDAPVRLVEVESP